MGRAGRTGLWLAFWPAGLFASLRHGRKKRDEQLVSRISATFDDQSMPSNPTAVIAVADRLKANGITNGGECLRLTAAAMKDVHDGVAVDEAVRRQVERRRQG